MTIFAGVQKREFVVIAADQKVHFLPGGAEPPAERPRFHQKVAIHSHLPLAMATMGPDLIPVGDPKDPGLHMFAWKWLEHFGERYTSQADLLLQHIQDDADKLLRPVHERWCALGGLDPSNPADRWSFLVAVVVGSSPALGRIRLGGGTTLEREPSFFCPPDSIAQAVGSLPELSMLRKTATESEDSDAVARALEQAVTATIRLEAAKHGGKNVEIGEPVDIVVVDGSGARPWHAK